MNVFAVLRPKSTRRGFHAVLTGRKPECTEIRRGIRFLDIQIPRNCPREKLDEVAGEYVNGRFIAGEGLVLPEGYIPFCPEEYQREVLVCSAVRAANYLSGIKKIVVALVDPLALYGAYAFNFMTAASEVRILTNRIGEYRALSEECLKTIGQPLTLTGEWSALRGSHLVVAPDGLSGLWDPQVTDTRGSVIFTPCEDDFEGGFIISNFKPSMGIFSMLCPPGVSELAFCGACYSLSGLRGLAELTPKTLLSKGRPVGFSEILQAVQG